MSLSDADMSSDGRVRKRGLLVDDGEREVDSKRQAVGRLADSLIGMSTDTFDTTGSEQLAWTGNETENGLFPSPEGDFQLQNEDYADLFWSSPSQHTDVLMTDLNDTFDLTSSRAAFWPSSEAPQDLCLLTEPVETAPTVVNGDEREEANVSSDVSDGLGQHHAIIIEDEDSEESHNSQELYEGSTNGKVSIEYDTCFGVLLLQAHTNFFATQKEEDDTPMLVRTSSNVIHLHHRTDKRVGVVISDGLYSLLDQFSVHLTATFAPEQPEKGRNAHIGKTGRARKALSRPVSSARRLVRLVIYGSLADRYAVGEHLSAAELFLQHPTMREYDQSVEYFNPHLLIRPGSRMPRIEELSIQAGEELPSSSRILDEAARSEVWRIFDSASGGNIVPEVAPSPRLKSILETHQLIALEMMTEREWGAISGAKFPTLWKPLLGQKDSRYRHAVTGWLQKNPIGLYGGILADEMGLGKTLSMLALICCDLDTMGDGVRKVEMNPKTTLVIVPKSALVVWETEIRRHLVNGSIKCTTYYGQAREEKVHELAEFDIVITTYDILRQDFQKKSGRKTLYSCNWRRAVLDEAHRIRSRSSQLHDAAIAISKVSQTRWCLTGTPIHNSLDDYAALLSFLQVQGLHDKKSFDKFVAIPIKQKKPGSMERLKELVLATSLRRRIAPNAANLGLQPRREKVETVKLDIGEREIYKFFQEKSCDLAKGMHKSNKTESSGGRKIKGDENILPLINFLRLICDYGDRILPNSALEAWNARDSEAANREVIQLLQRFCGKCNASLQNVDDADILPCGHEMCSCCRLTIEETHEDAMDLIDACSICQRDSSLGSKGSLSGRSAKVKALIRNLRAEQCPQGMGVAGKSIVFSCWTKMLDLVQRDLEDEGFDVERIDGQSSLDERRKAIHRFNQDAKCTVMLASIGSSGEGIDLTAACNVHILEPQWNPMTESQAVARVHRFGQKQRVTVTRYIVDKSVEKYVQEIQSDKLRLISLAVEHDAISQSDVD